MNDEHVKLERELRAMLHRQATRAEFSDDPLRAATVGLSNARYRTSSRRVVFAAAAVVLLATGGVAVAMWLPDDGNRVSTFNTQALTTPPVTEQPAPPSTLEPATDATPSPTTATTSPAQRLDAATLNEFLGLPEPWTISSASSQVFEVSGWSMTIQRWGTIGDDGVSFDRVVELGVFPAADGIQDLEMRFELGLTDTVSAEWVTAGYRYYAKAFGLNAEQATAFVHALRARAPDTPMAGFDSPADDLPLAEEQIGSNEPLHPAPWLTIELTDPSGRSASIDVYNRDGLPRSLGAPNRRVRIGDRIGVLSPPDFFSLTVDWAGDGIHYRAGVPKELTEALELADTINRHDDAEWQQLLDLAAQTPGPGAIIEPEVSDVAGPTSFLADQLTAEATGATINPVDDGRIGVTLPDIDDSLFVTRYRAVTVEGERPPADLTIPSGDLYIDPTAITLLTPNGNVIRVTCSANLEAGSQVCDNQDGQPIHLTAMVDLAVTVAELPADQQPATRYDNLRLVFTTQPTLDDFSAETSFGIIRLRDYNGLPLNDPPLSLTAVLIPPE